MEDERFCPQCGQDSYVPLTGFYRPPAQNAFQPMPRSAELPQLVPMAAPSKPLFPKGIILGLIGGIVGLNLAIITLWLANFGENLGADSTEIYGAALLILLLSIVGLAGCFLESSKMAGGILMWIAAIGLFFSFSWIGWISVISFALGGAVMVWGSREEKGTVIPVRAPLITSPPVAVPPAPVQEEALPSEDVAPQSSEDEIYEVPRRKWTKKEWRDNTIAAVAIILILAGALFAVWYFYAR